MKKIFFYLIFSIFCITSNLYAQNIEIKLCSEKTENKVEKEWGIVAALAIDKLRYVGYKQSNQNYKILFDYTKECFEQSGKSCNTVNNTVYCNKCQLARLAAGIGISSIGMEPVKDSNSSKTNWMNNIDMTSAMMLSDVLLEGVENKEAKKVYANLMRELNVPFEKIIEIQMTLPQLYKYDLYVDEKILYKFPKIAMAHPVMEASLNYVIGYILGHELAHAFSNCPFQDNSNIEKNGLFNKFVALQSRGNILCPNILLMNEILADQCALRVVTKLDKAMTIHKEKEAIRLYRDEKSSLQALHSISRRNAIDAFSFMLLTGLGSTTNTSINILPKGTDGLPTIAYRMHNSSGYLYQALRMLFFSSELKEMEQYNKQIVSICGETAKRFVLSASYAISHCWEYKTINRRLLSETFQDFVPKGVVKAWRTNEWDDSNTGSFICE